MDRQTRLAIEDRFERNNGLLVPTEYGSFVIPKGAKILKGGGPQVKENWGEDVKLTAGISVLSKDGELKSDREWEAKSFTRWFGRLMQGLLDNTSPVMTDFQGNSFFSPWTAGLGARPMANLTQFTNPGFGQPGGQYQTGGVLAIGNGAYGGVDSGFTNLKALLFFQACQQDGINTQEDAAALAFYMTTGITLATIGGATIQEIGLFSRFLQQFTGNTHMVLLAYDEVSPGVVAAYGDVVAPKYSMSFAA